MASTNKTETLGLNQWIGSDKPKMEDFNSDNRLIDTALAGHRADQTVHVSAQERAAWNAAAPVIGSYTGDGQEERGHWGHDATCSRNSF